MKNSPQAQTPTTVNGVPIIPRNLELAQWACKKEPDFAAWVNIPAAKACKIARHIYMGHLCGYVGVGPKHPYFGKSDTEDSIYNLLVHSGVTYTGYMKKSKLWWIGFDCGHLGDISPVGNFIQDENCIYRDFKYVKKETNKLAMQLVLVNILETKLTNAYN